MVSFPLAVALVAGLLSTAAPGRQSGAPADAGAAQTPGAILTPRDRGEIFMARKMYREAIEAFSQGSKDDPVIANEIGIAYHQLGQLDKAKQYYERALKLNPRYAEARNNLGAAYYAGKSFRRAIAAYKRALEIQPRSSSFHMNLGMAYFARKMEKEAMDEYQTALQIDPTVLENRGTFGTVLEDRNVENRARYHYAMARICAKAGMNDEAIQYLRRALEEGFKDRKKLEQDAEFEAMRDLPEFKALLALEPRVL